MIDHNASQNTGLDLGICDGNIALLQWNQDGSPENHCTVAFFNQLLKELESLKKRVDLKGQFLKAAGMIAFYLIMIGLSFVRKAMIPTTKKACLKQRLHA